MCWLRGCFLSTWFTVWKKPTPRVQVCSVYYERTSLQYNNQTKLDYRKFLAIFATHNMHKCDLAGRVKTVISVKMCKAELDDYNEIKVWNWMLRQLQEVWRVLKLKFKNMESFSSEFNERFSCACECWPIRHITALNSKAGSTSLSNCQKCLWSDVSFQWLCKVPDEPPDLLPF